MFGLNFSKLPRHRKFDYSPIYYDPSKEDLHERVTRAKVEMGEVDSTQDLAENNIRRAFERKKNINRYAIPSPKHYRLRLIVIATVLTILFYKLLTSNVLDSVFKHLVR